MCTEKIVASVNRLEAGFAILPTSRGCAFDSSTANGARGTRLLFDALLASQRLQPSEIVGYDREEFTHMATAATVRAGMADVAFGIEAAARVHQLAFVGLVTERYYLACRRSAPARIAVDTMVATARGDAFRRAIARVGGYDCDASGDRVHLADLFGGRQQD